jgi:translation elongation factor EF-1alpha
MAVKSSLCNWKIYKTKKHSSSFFDVFPIPIRGPDDPLRILVLENGNEIFGKVESGMIKQGDKVKLMPSGI